MQRRNRRKVKWKVSLEASHSSDVGERYWCLKLGLEALQVGGRVDTCDNILMVILTDISQGLSVEAKGRKA